LLILVAFGFVSMGFWAVGAFGPPPVSDRASPAVSNAFGWLCIVFFGFGGLVLIKAYFYKRERLRINASGIHWTLWSEEMIPWSEISDITTWQFRFQKWIVLHLRDAELFPSASPLAKLSRASRALTGGDVAISLTGTDRSYRETMEAIRRFR
jgi:hypothetical protein